MFYLLRVLNSVLNKSDVPKEKEIFSVFRWFIIPPLVLLGIVFAFFAIMYLISEFGLVALIGIIGVLAYLFWMIS